MPILLQHIQSYSYYEVLAVSTCSYNTPYIISSRKANIQYMTMPDINAVEASALVKILSSQNGHTNTRHSPAQRLAVWC